MLVTSFTVVLSSAHRDSVHIDAAHGKTPQNSMPAQPCVQNAPVYLSVSQCISACHSVSAYNTHCKASHMCSLFCCLPLPNGKRGRHRNDSCVHIMCPANICQHMPQNRGTDVLRSQHAVGCHGWNCSGTSKAEGPHASTSISKAAAAAEIHIHMLLTTDVAIPCWAFDNAEGPGLVRDCARHDIIAELAPNDLFHAVHLRMVATEGIAHVPLNVYVSNGHPTHSLKTLNI